MLLSYFLSAGAVYSRQGVQQQSLNQALCLRGSSLLTAPAGRRFSAKFATGVSMQAQAQGKAVVITGAAGGVGYAYADEFLANGMKVMIGSFSRMIVSFFKSVRIYARPNARPHARPHARLHARLHARPHARPHARVLDDNYPEAEYEGYS